MNPYIKYIIIAIILFIILFFLHNSYYIKNINIYENNDLLEEIEKKFNKLYPIDNDFFSITHYPKYISFFNQFNKIKYYTYEKNKNILGTCCFAKFKNIDAYYICDLKSKNKGKNITYNIFKQFFIRNLNFSVFGIVMQPNIIIDKLKNKYYFTEYETLNLYEIEYKILLKNLLIFIEYFGEIKFTHGYKILNIYDKNNNLKNKKQIIHICTSNDKKYVNNLQYICNKINFDDKIMFCIPSKNSFNNILNSNNIVEINKMSIIGFGCELSDITPSVKNIFNNNISFGCELSEITPSVKNIDWKFIRTYMI